MLGPPSHLLYHCLHERVGWSFCVWLFYENMKDTFSEGLSYITHFAVLHPFLTRTHILLTFIRHLTLTKSNLSEKNEVFSFEESLSNSILLVHIAKGSVDSHMLTLLFFTATILKILCVCGYCCKLFVLTFLFFVLIYFFKWCILYFVLYSVLMLYL